jgi:hypothetical protein
MNTAIALLHFGALAFEKDGECGQDGGFTNVIAADEGGEIINFDLDRGLEPAKIVDFNAAEFHGIGFVLSGVTVL